MHGRNRLSPEELATRVAKHLSETRHRPRLRYRPWFGRLLAGSVIFLVAAGAVAAIWLGVGWREDRKSVGDAEVLGVGGIEAEHGAEPSIPDAVETVDPMPDGFWTEPAAKDYVAATARATAPTLEHPGAPPLVPTTEDVVAGPTLPGATSTTVAQSTDGAGSAPVISTSTPTTNPTTGSSAPASSSPTTTATTTTISTSTTSSSSTSSTTLFETTSTTCAGNSGTGSGNNCG